MSYESKTGGKKMEKETRDERMTSFETKMAVAKAFLYKCGTTIEELEERIAKESIDYTGARWNYNLFIGIVRERKEILTEYYEEWVDLYNDHERFWFRFSIYHYQDLPSGFDVSQDNKGYAIYEGGKAVERVSFEDLQAELICDLTERGYGKLRLEIEDFVDELYDWIME